MIPKHINSTYFVLTAAIGITMNESLTEMKNLQRSAVSLLAFQKLLTPRSHISAD